MKCELCGKYWFEDSANFNAGENWKHEENVKCLLSNVRVNPIVAEYINAAIRQAWEEGRQSAMLNETMQGLIERVQEAERELVEKMKENLTLMQEQEAEAAKTTVFKDLQEDRQKQVVRVFQLEARIAELERELAEARDARKPGWVGDMDTGVIDDAEGNHVCSVGVKNRAQNMALILGTRLRGARKPEECEHYHMAFPEMAFTCTRFGVTEIGCCPCKAWAKKGGEG